uniref:Serine protease gd N-terminal domain-containing protein n=1 Tax=Megaselia scalaris TaxID=36166 RepID=T1GSP8_MEGSC
MKSLHIKPLIFCTIILLLHKSRAQNNPCPSVFQYSRDSNENFGLFTLNGAQMGQSVVVDVEFSVRGRLTSSYYGEIMLVSGKEEAVQKILRNQPVIYKIRFPVQNQLPTITNIKVNDNVVCEGKDEGGYVSRVSLQHTLHTKVITGYGPGDSDQEQEEHIHHNPQHSAYRPVPVPMPSRPRPRPGPTSSRPSSPPVRPSSPPVRPTSPPLHENLPIFSQFLNNMAFTGATTKRPAPTATTSRTTTTSAPT